MSKMAPPSAAIFGGLAGRKRFILGMTLMAGFMFAVKSLQIKDCQMLRSGLDAFAIWAPVLLVSTYLVATSTFLPATILTLLSGLFFGPWWGSGLIVLASTLSALIGFILVRYVARNFMTAQLEQQAWFGKFTALTSSGSFKALLLARLSPAFPVAGFNYASATARTSLATSLLASTLGLLPGTFVYAFLGHTACTVIEPISSGQLLSSSPQLRFSLMLCFVLMAALSLLPLLVKKLQPQLSQPQAASLGR